MKMELVIERNGDDLWGRIEREGKFLPVTVASTTKGVIEEIKSLIEDYLKHEGADDETWNKINIADLEFDIHYDVQALFMEFDFLNISKVAIRAGINPALLRHYASGVKYPSATQAKKIESTIHQLAAGMNKASVYAE